MSNTRRPKNPALSSRDSTPRSTQTVVVVVALLCVGAIVAIALVLRGGRNDSTQPVSSAVGPTSAASVAPSTDTGAPPSSSTTSALPAVLHCDPAPALPAHPRTYSKPPDPSLSRHTAWDATISTNCGDITVRLDGAKAPQTVASFLFLSRRGFFDDSPCTRLTTLGNFLLQCGDPTGTGDGDPGYGYGIENAPKSGVYPTGTVAMARSSSPNSNGSQFFIVYKGSSFPTSGGGYTVLGKVTKGLEIVKALGQAGVVGGGSDGPPAQPVSILGVQLKAA